MRGRMRPAGRWWSPAVRPARASVRAALEVLPSETQVVAIHDAARPFAPPDLFTAVIEGVSELTPGVVPVVPVTDTVKHVVGGRVVRTARPRAARRWRRPRKRSTSPSCARRTDMQAVGRRVDRRRCGARARSASPWLRSPVIPATSRSRPSSIWPTPMPAWVATMAEPPPRVGLGFDVHPWADDDRALWLGGVRFEGDRGSAGHSDGDAVCHALADALLGAAALGDVGSHFPDSDPAIDGIAGLRALEARALALVHRAGLAFRVVRCDRDLRSSGDRASTRRDASGDSQMRSARPWTRCR